MPRPNTNRYEFDGNTVKIITIKNQVILIDSEDFERCKSVSWCVDNVGYANGCYKRKTVRMHRFILNAPKGFEVDHINHNRLDNRKSNLRIVTHQENQHNLAIGKSNTSGYKGVYYNIAHNKWCCQIKVNGKSIAKLFNTKDEAIAKRKELESIYHKIEVSANH